MVSLASSVLGPNPELFVRNGSDCGSRIILPDPDPYLFACLIFASFSSKWSNSSNDSYIFP
jgi:hypothetical protein